MPITAATLYREPSSGALYVLAGEDTDLVIYRASSVDETLKKEEVQTAVARIKVLSAQPIHGIHVHQPSPTCDGRLLLWGGSSVVMMPLSDLSLHGAQAEPEVAIWAQRMARIRAPDWIYDGAVCPADSNLAVLATAHNEVITVRFREEEGNATAVLESHLVSPSRPMLYAARVRWTGEREVLVAAGTVFGDILVWKHSFEGAKGEQPPMMLFSLSGHEGSIFSVDMSPLMEMPDGSTVRLLASCSDDRTIRIWNITEVDGGEGAGDVSAVQVQETSDTGFRCAPAVYGEDGAGGRADVSPVAVVMGHASRIWGVRFGLPSVERLTSSERHIWGGAEENEKDMLSVYSFGEDATVQRWQVDIVDALQTPLRQSSLTHKATYALHNGKHLWSRDILCSITGGVATTHIITGGADSKMTLVKEMTGSSSVEEDIYNHAQIWDIHDIAPAAAPSAPKPVKSRKEVISRYDFVTPDAILAVSNMGRVLLGTFRGKDATWEELAVEDKAVAYDMANVYALKTVSYGGALLGSTTGGVYYFGLDARAMSKVASLAGRVVEMNALSKTFEGAPGDAEAIVHLHRDSTSVYMTLDRTTGQVKTQEPIAGLDERFVAISAARIDDLLAIGSRHGWIALLRRDSEGTFRPILDLPPLSGDSVTAIVPLPPSLHATEGSRTRHVLTTSRDGCYRIFELHVDEAGARMMLLHETSPPFGPWIEGAWFTGGDARPELILYGFRSKDFVVWNETRREELATMDCGGAHRTFRLACDERAPASRAGDMRFAFTRTSKLSVHGQKGVPHETVRLGVHGREVRSLTAKSNGRYIATGAEDATIRLWEYEHGDNAKGNNKKTDGKVGRRTGRLRYMAYLKRHVSGLQKLQWAGDEYLFSSAGNEEMFAWRVRPLDSAYASGAAVMCEGVFDDRSPVSDLRIMDFDVHYCSSSSSSGDGDRPAAVLVTMAFSNSALRTYRYTADGGFRLVCEGLYTGACLTQARHLRMEDEGGLHVLTASTDGHVAIWRGACSSSSSSSNHNKYGDGSNKESKTPQGKYELAQTLPVHQSSIKSLDMTRLAGSGPVGYGVVTGGDDNALAFTLLKPAAATSRTGAEAEEAEEEEKGRDQGDAGDVGFTAALRAVVRRAHAAAITGIAITSGHRQDGQVTWVSVSNDQWVKTWRIRAEEDEGEGEGEVRSSRLQLTGEAYSGVADAGDVTLLDAREEDHDDGGDDGSQEDDGRRRRVDNFRGRVMVGGVGLEVWRLE